MRWNGPTSPAPTAWALAMAPLDARVIVLVEAAAACAKAANTLKMIMARAKLNQHHRISREQLSVREHMAIVLRTLSGRRFVEFHELFDTTRGTPVLVVTFIAMLELAKETLIEITQAEAFAPIYVRLAYSPT